MVLRMWMSWHVRGKAATGGEKFFESIGVLRVAGGAVSAEPQSAASATVSDIFIATREVCPPLSLSPRAVGTI